MTLQNESNKDTLEPKAFHNNRVDPDLVEAFGKPCLSVIIPLKTKSSERFQNHNLIRHAGEQARRLLDHTITAPQEKSVMKERLAVSLAALDFNHLKEGVGLFISPRISRHVDFSIPVTGRIMLGDSFETRDIFYLAQAHRSYYILNLTAQYIRLFHAVGRTLTEIKDSFFPCRYVDTHEYAKPSRANSYGTMLKSFEKDKGTLVANRISLFLKNVDRKLSSYVSDPGREVVLAGQARMISVMETLPNVAKHVAAKVPGSYANLEKLSTAAWTAIQSHRADEEHVLIASVLDAPSERRVSGIEEVMEAAKRGQGLLLLVERSYSYPAARNLDGNPPVSDVVDDAIETVHLKGGRVVFVKDDELATLGRIVLLLRYP